MEPTVGQFQLWEGAPVGKTSAATEHKLAMNDWHAKNASVRSKLNQDAEYKRMDNNVAQNKRDYEITRNKGNMVTSENGRAVEEGRA